MSANLTLILTASVLVGCGVSLMLQRSLTRVLVGIVLLSNGVNLGILLAGGPAGDPPLVDKAAPDTAITDPLPQALMLTAIVITLGTTAFILALAYRRWQLSERDDVQDDMEDALIARLAKADAPSDTYDTSTPDGVERRRRRRQSPSRAAREPDGLEDDS